MIAGRIHQQNPNLTQVEIQCKEASLEGFAALVLMLMGNFPAQVLVHVFYGSFLQVNAWHGV